jgi:hypothetical protein
MLARQVDDDDGFDDDLELYPTRHAPGSLERRRGLHVTPLSAGNGRSPKGASTVSPSNFSEDGIVSPTADDYSSDTSSMHLSAYNQATRSSRGLQQPTPRRVLDDSSPPLRPTMYRQANSSKTQMYRGAASTPGSGHETLVREHLVPSDHLRRSAHRGRHVDGSLSGGIRMKEVHTIYSWPAPARPAHPPRELCPASLAGWCPHHACTPFAVSCHLPRHPHSIPPRAPAPSHSPARPLPPHR